MKDDDENTIIIDTRVYKDKQGHEVTEYVYKDLRLRTKIQCGQKIFNYQDIQSFDGYSAEEVFAFLTASLGDELFKYIDEKKKGAC